MAIFVVAGLLGAVAQVAPKAVAEVPFSFIAAGMAFPPGTYQVNPAKAPNEIVISNNQTGQSVIVAATTGLRPKPGEEPMIVFDKVDSTHYFSELYLGGSDGYAVQGAEGEHTHVQLKAKK